MSTAKKQNIAVQNSLYQGDAYPFTKTHFDTQHHVEKFLDLSQATAIGKFMILLTLKLVMSPKLPLSAPDYGKEIEAGIDGFMSRYADNMDTNGIPVSNFHEYKYVKMNSAVIIPKGQIEKLELPAFYL